MPAMTADPTAVRRLAELFRALGDPIRLRLLGHLAGHGEADADALAAACGQRAPLVGHHLGILSQAGLIEVRPGPDGRAYRLAAGGLGSRVAAAPDGLDYGAVVVKFPRDGSA